MRRIKGPTYRRIVPQWEDPDNDEQVQMPVLEWLSVPRRNGRPIAIQTVRPETDEMWLSWIDFFEARSK
jgi:hypothetical protein